MMHKYLKDHKPSLAPFVMLMMLMAVSLTSSAQAPIVNLDVKNVTVKELLHQIEAKTNYTFAYSDSDFNLTKTVSLKANGRSIISIVKEFIPEAKVEISGNKIILTKVYKVSASPQSPQRKMKTVTGKVLDQDGKPVVGAGVVLRGTKTGTVTDLDGRYVLDLPQSAATLDFTSIGYAAVTVMLAEGQIKADVTMKETAITLDDLVVVGYGVQNSRDVTTSISSIKAKDFAQLSSTDFRDAMAAKMPGVQVLQLGGQPDGNVSIRVRGIQSATSGNDPLYVIDGIPGDDRAFSNLSSNDIQSLEVLKDASAAAIYGSRGSCGVIIVTTKRGATEKPTISYDGQVGVSQVAKKIDMLDAYEWAQMYKEARDGAYLFNVPTGSMTDPYESRPQTYHRVDDLVTAYLMDDTGTLTNTDWQDEIFRNAISTQHSLSVSARTKEMNYYIGANYLKRQGTIIGSDFERYGIRANFDGNRGRLKYGISFSPSYSKTHYVNSDSQYGDDGVIASALEAPPIFPVYNEDGSYNWDMNGLLRTRTWDTQVNPCGNPVAYALDIKDVREKVDLSGNAYISLQLLKGLEYKFTAGGDFFSYNRDYYRPSWIPLTGMNYLDKASDPTMINNSNQYYHWDLSNQLTYSKKINDHSINAVAVFESEKQTTKSATIQGMGTAGDDKITTSKGKTIDQDNTVNSISSYTFSSWLARAQYSYKGRYMLSASIRGDGSSRFAPNTRWGYFPAASAGWRISDEDFMGKFTFIDDMKLRASVGQTGNAQIGNSEYLALYGTSTTDLGSGLTTVVYPSQIANNDLGWEKNTQYDLGVDVSFWKHYLSLTADLYYTKTTNMLFDVPVSVVSGLSSSNLNIGSMENKGIELTVSSNHKYGDFSYGFSANWSLNRNKVLHLGDEDAPIIKSASYSGAYYITEVGKPVGCYYLLVQDGIFHNQQELDAYPHFSTSTIGDFRFVDANGDGTLEKDEDRVIVGNYMPDFYYGFSFNLGYGDFDINANFQGVYGNEILNLERRYLLNMEASSNMMKESLQRFPYGELNRATRKSSGNDGSCTSTFHLEDGSYLRLQNLSFGYTLPEKWFKRLGVRNLRVYLQASNLFTLTNYTGYNPEVNKRPDDALRPGEDYCSYPVSRSFSFGVNFNL